MIKKIKALYEYEKALFRTLSKQIESKQIIQKNLIPKRIEQTKLPYVLKTVLSEQEETKFDGYDNNKIDNVCRSGESNKSSFDYNSQQAVIYSLYLSLKIFILRKNI